MRVVAVTVDPVRLSFLGALLRDAGIGSVVLDAHIAAVEGGIGAFPRRLAVAAADEAAALAVLREAGEMPAGNTVPPPSVAASAIPTDPAPAAEAPTDATPDGETAADEAPAA